MNESSRAWKMSKWDYAVETMFSAVEFLLSNAICGGAAMIASAWLVESLGGGTGFSFFEAFTIAAAIDLLLYRLLPGRSDRDLSKPHKDRLAGGLVRDLISGMVILGTCGILILCMHYL